MSKGCKKGHRDGGKIGGRHTTVTETAGQIVDVLDRFPEVTCISLGVIEPTPGKSAGCRHMKVIPHEGFLLLKIRGNGSVQELRVYSRDWQKTRSGLAEVAQQNGIILKEGL